MKKRFFQLLKFGLAVALLFAVMFFIPMEVTIDGPRFARLEQRPPDGTDFGVDVQWWNLILNRQTRRERFPIPGGGRLALPPCRISTNLGRRILEWSLTNLHLWQPCRHCYGPAIRCSLYNESKYVEPKGMRLAQGQYEKDGEVVFTVALLPDESQFEQRPFEPNNVARLLDECRLLIAKGESSNINPAGFGDELKRLNPVRVECMQGAIVLWMGGETGYAIAPDQDGCPAFNLLMVSGTKDEHIFQLTRIDRLR